MDRPAGCGGRDIEVIPSVGNRVDGFDSCSISSRVNVCRPRASDNILRRPARTVWRYYLCVAGNRTPVAVCDEKRGHAVATLTVKGFIIITLLLITHILP